MDEKFNIYEEVEMPQGLKESIMNELKKEKRKAVNRKYYVAAASVLIIFGATSIIGYNLLNNNMETNNNVAINNAPKKIEQKADMIESRNNKESTKMMDNVNNKNRFNQNVKKSINKNIEKKPDMTTTQNNKSNIDKNTKKTNKSNDIENKININNNAIAYNAKTSVSKSEKSNIHEDVKGKNVSSSNNTADVDSTNIADNNSRNINDSSMAGNSNSKGNNEVNNNKKNNNNNMFALATPDASSTNASAMPEESKIAVNKSPKMAVAALRESVLRIDITFKNLLQSNDEIIKEIEKNNLKYQNNDNNIEVQCNKEQYLKFKDDLKSVYSENLIINEPETINSETIEVFINIKK